MEKIKIVNVYLAGKISVRCFRNELVNGLRGAQEGRENHIDIPSSGSTSFNYVGPFFISCDHGCAHGPGLHGAAADKFMLEKSRGCLESAQETTPRTKVVYDCLTGIEKADFIIAYIDSVDCYGTLFELGYAKGLNKNIIVCVPQSLRYDVQKELWFTFYSTCVEIIHDNKKNFSIEQLWSSFLNNKPIELGVKAAHN